MISYEETQQIEQELKKTYPQYVWEENQVYMHHIVRVMAPYRKLLRRGLNTPSSAHTCSSL